VAIISQVKLIVETNPDYQARVSYQLNFSKCEALGQFVFLEQVNLFTTDPAGDRYLATLYKTCVKAQTGCLNRDLQVAIPLRQVLTEPGGMLATGEEALYVRVTLVPYAPQTVENLSNPVYL
jgi:hypothetical protein